MRDASVASGGIVDDVIIVDTKDSGSAKLRAKLGETTRGLPAEEIRRLVSIAKTTTTPAATRASDQGRLRGRHLQGLGSPRRHLQGTGIPHPPPTAVLPPRTLRFVPAEVPQTKATRLWTPHPSKLPATVARVYRPPHTTTNQEHFEYLTEERESFSSAHFNKKNEMTEYLRQAIRTKVNLKATGH